MKKEIKRFFNKVVTFGGVIAVSKTEMGMDYVQVLPDNPSVGQVEAFHGFGYGQLLNNGSFEFIRKKRHRSKAEFRGGYASLKFCADGYDRITIVVPNELRHKLPTILRKDIYKVIAYLIKEGWSK